MDFQSAIKKIDKYLDSSAHAPIIVDVRYSTMLSHIQSMYGVGSNIFVRASKYCGQDTLPQMDKLKDELSKMRKKVFLTELSTYLKLEGEEEATRELYSMLELQLEGKLVIVTYNAKQILEFTDHRPYDSGRVIEIDEGEALPLPTLYFVAPELSGSFDVCYQGFKNLALAIEQAEQQAARKALENYYQ